MRIKIISFKFKKLKKSFLNLRDTKLINIFTFSFMRKSYVLTNKLNLDPYEL